MYNARHSYVSLLYINNKLLSRQPESVVCNILSCVWRVGVVPSNVYS